MQNLPRVTNVAVPASGAAPVLIKLSMLASKVEVTEDPSYNAGVAQGLKGYYMDPTAPASVPAMSNPNLQVWLPNTAGQRGQGFQPIVFGGEDARVHGGKGDYVGGQNSAVLQVTSATATATGVIVTEWP